MSVNRFIVGAVAAVICLTGWSEPAFGQAAPYKTGYRYDLAGRVTGVILPDPDGTGPIAYAATRNTYDPNYGTLIKVEKGELSSWPAEYVDPVNWTGFTIQQVTNLSYDNDGNLTQKTVSGADAVVQTFEQRSFDAFDHLVCDAVRMDPTQWSSQADPCTPQTTGSFGADRITQTTYNPQGQLLQVQHAYGTSLQENYEIFTYASTPDRDAYLNFSDPDSVTDANGNLSNFQYGGSVYSKRTKWTFPSPTTVGSVNAADYEQYGYDANGNRTTLRKRDGRTLTYTYDALDRVISKCATATTCSQPLATTGRDVYFAYDLLGHQLSAKFDNASGPDGVVNTFDGFGELTSSTLTMGAFTKSICSTSSPCLYDADSNRVQVTVDSQPFTYAYDGLNRLAAIYEGSGTATPLDTFVYNNEGNLASRNEAPGGGVSYSYDQIDRLIAQSHTFPAATASNVTWSFTSSDSVRKMSPANQIINVARDNDSYAYTGLVAVNRGYAVNGLDQYTSAGPANFTYDLNGNLAGDGTSTYIYDIENRLVSKTSPGVTANVTYDPVGRLFEVVQGSADTRFLYDGDALVAEYDGTGAITNRYVHGSNAAADDPFVWYVGTGTGTKRFLHADHLGSIVAVTNTNAAPTINSYDEYGIPQTDAATHTTNVNAGRFQYTGQVWISELGMYYYKARIYSPTIGRFMQTDPIGYKDQINLYEYVGDNPIDFTDYTGTQCASATVTSAHGGTHQTVVYRCSNNSTTTRSGGSRAWRDNNPGNITAGKFSNGEGAVGAAGGKNNNKFAVFPTRDTGDSALSDLLNSKAVKARTVAGEIEKYAPPSDGNDTKTYQDQVTQATGVPAGTSMSNLTADQMGRVKATIETREGWTVGKENNVQDPPLPPR